LLEGSGGEANAFAALSNSGTQKKRAQVLLYSARADAQLAGNFFITAALHQQVQHLPVAGRDFHSIEIHHSGVLRFFLSDFLISCLVPSAFLHELV
jgi:hypothetical protein